MFENTSDSEIRGSEVSTWWFSALVAPQRFRNLGGGVGWKDQGLPLLGHSSNAIILATLSTGYLGDLNLGRIGLGKPNSPTRTGSNHLKASRAGIVWTRVLE